MTISTTTIKNSFSGNGSTTEFTYTFNFRPKSAKETEEVKDIINLFTYNNRFFTIKWAREKT